MEEIDKLIYDIEYEIETINKKIGIIHSDTISDATNRVAISNLYLALAQLRISKYKKP